MKEALIIIDMLNDFTLEGAPLEVPENRRIIPAIKREIERARRAGKPVIYLCDSHAPDDREFEKFGWPPHAVTGKSGSQVVDEIKPEDGDTIIKKSTYSGFYGTDLDETLKALGIGGVRMTGCLTHICILFISYEIVLRDIEVTVVADAVADVSPELHQASFKIMKDVGIRIDETFLKEGYR